MVGRGEKEQQEQEQEQERTPTVDLLPYNNIFCDNNSSPSPLPASLYRSCASTDSRCEGKGRWAKRKGRKVQGKEEEERKEKKGRGRKVG